MNSAIMNFVNNMKFCTHSTSEEKTNTEKNIVEGKVKVKDLAEDVQSDA